MSRHRIIVLEGPDGVGKTTLADAISEALPGDVVRMNSGPPPKDEPTVLHYWDRLDEIEELSKTSHVVVDRFHVGEMVYGPILRGSSGMSIDEATVIDMRLMAMGACLVHCYLSSDKMIERLFIRDGGKPDEKSGATVGHSYAIRAGFIGMLGRETLGERRMPAYWEVADMSMYPAQLARRATDVARNISALRQPTGCLGYAFNDTVVVLPDDDVVALAELVRHLRMLGRLTDTTIVYGSHCTWSHRVNDVIVVGEKSDALLSLTARTVLKEMDGSLEWRQLLSDAINEKQRHIDAGNAKPNEDTV